MFIGVGEQLLALLVGRIGEYDVLQRHRDPAVIALIVVGLRFLHHGIGATHVLYILLRRLLGRQLIERRGVGIIKTHVALVDGTGVVLHRAVVAPVRPHLIELLRQLDHVR